MIACHNVQSMRSTSLNGVLTRFVKSPGFWLIFPGLLLWILMKKKMHVQIQVTAVPTPFLQAMERAFKGTEYEKQLVNWIAVSKMETAGWTSPLYVQYLNPWGMRCSRVRNNTQSGCIQTTSNGEFATYHSLDAAAQDIILYMRARRYPTDLDLFSLISIMGQKSYFVGESVWSYYSKVKAWLDRKP